MVCIDDGWIAVAEPAPGNILAGPHNMSSVRTRSVSVWAISPLAL